jgi:hypothetical protein
MCDCINITFQLAGSDVTQTIQANANGTFGGFNTYEFTFDGVTYSIWNDGSWEVSTDGVEGVELVTFWESSAECPTASMPDWVDEGYFDTFITAPCSYCTCVRVEWTDEDGTQYFSANIAGILNGYYYYSFIYLANNYFISYSEEDSCWYLTQDSTGGEKFARLILDSPCPLSAAWESIFIGVTIVTRQCVCSFREDRIFRQYEVVKLPDTFVEQNRGLKDCCCSYYVLGSPDQETWKKDQTSAWIKLSGLGDTYEFELLKNGLPTTYICPNYSFINEPNAFYTTVEWSDVLASDGVGCYTLKVRFIISGVEGEFIWGKYDLKPYTIQNALKTARIKAIFNGYHEVDQIDFTASNVESTHRFFGYIGNRQPNTEIDNIIYDNREMKRVIRENLNDYEIITEPSDECIIRPMVELYLLSENQLFISDYNAHNHSYRYLDLPVIVSESAQIEYKDLSRKATLTCKVSDKFKSNRTYYNG